LIYRNWTKARKTRELAVKTAQVTYASTTSIVTRLKERPWPMGILSWGINIRRLPRRAIQSTATLLRCGLRYESHKQIVTTTTGQGRQKRIGHVQGGLMLKQQVYHVPQAVAPHLFDRVPVLVASTPGVPSILWKALCTILRCLHSCCVHSSCGTLQPMIGSAGRCEGLLLAAAAGCGSLAALQ
jgi:hypothetical protein